MDSHRCQYKLHSAISISVHTFLLLLAYFFCQVCISFRPAQSANKIIVSTSRYSKKFAHDRYWIFCAVTIDDSVFCLCPHFLSVDCRKSRNNAFSIFKRLFSYLYSCNVLAGLRPRCFGMPWICFLRSRISKYLTTFLSLNPKCSAISRWVFPSSIIAVIAGNSA